MKGNMSIEMQTYEVTAYYPADCAPDDPNIIGYRAELGTNSVQAVSMAEAAQKVRDIILDPACDWGAHSRAEGGEGYALRVIVIGERESANFLVEV